MLYTHKLPPLTQAIFIKRYKRFLVDVYTKNSTFTIHCPNSGSMRGLLREGMPVWMSTAQNLKRKLAHTLEIVQPSETLVGVNTHRANTIVHEALQAGVLSHIYPHTRIHPEYSVDKGSRLDFMLETPEGPVFLEVKNVTMAHNSCALFPDATTIRGTKHMRLLSALSMQHNVRCGVIFLIQRNDCHSFAPAQDIDPAYHDALITAQRTVNILTFFCQVTPHAITLTDIKASHSRCLRKTPETAADAAPSPDGHEERS